MRKLNKTIFIAIALLAVNFSVSLAFASQSSDKQLDLQSQLQAVKDRESSAAFQQAEADLQLQLSSGKLVKAQKKLNDLQTQLNKTIALKSDAEAKLKKSQIQLDELDASLATAKLRLAARRQVFDKRLAGAYMNGDSTVVFFLLESKNLGDFVNRLSLLRIIAEADSKVILDVKQLTASISDRVGRIKAAKNTAEQRQKDLTAQESTIRVLTTAMVAEEARLETEVSQKQQKYDQITRQKDRLAQSASLLQANFNQDGTIQSGGQNRAADRAPADIKNMAAAVAVKYGIPMPLFNGLITQESGWNYQAVSRSGALGLTQVMPFNVIAMGYDIQTFKNSPDQQLEAGAIYLSRQYGTFGQWDLALAAYNAGPGAVLKYNGIPPYSETQNYVRNILSMAGMPANQ